MTKRRVHMSLFILCCEEEMGDGVNLKVLFFLIWILNQKNIQEVTKATTIATKNKESCGSIQCSDLGWVAVGILCGLSTD